jgi:hypothetical protein
MLALYPGFIRLAQLSIRLGCGLVHNLVAEGA